MKFGILAFNVKREPREETRTRIHLDIYARSNKVVINIVLAAIPILGHLI
jgi:hypothetical protein